MLVSSQYFYHQNPGINLHFIRMLVNMNVYGVMMIGGVTLEEYKIQNMSDHSNHWDLSANVVFIFIYNRKFSNSIICGKIGLEVTC